MFCADELLKVLRRRCQVPDAAALCVAFSGGLDSTVLLHALASLRAETGFRVRAVHVNHGLHPDAAIWAEHCLRTAAALGVDCKHVTVRVSERDGLGLEAGARKARYAALEADLCEAEYLLVAHHADDQLETMLLALMRGAGVEGLAAMPPVRRLGQGWLARPMLGWTRPVLQAWAEAQGLSWLSDPSNTDEALDRNFLRQRITPVLQQRWPVAPVTAARSAEHLQAAAASLHDLAVLDAMDALHGNCLRVASLRNLPPLRRDNLLRHWLRQHGAQMPSTRKLTAIVQVMLGAAADRLPCVEWGAWQVRRHRDLLYCVCDMPAEPGIELDWPLTEPLVLPGGSGDLQMLPAPAGRRGLDPARLGEALTVVFRSPHQAMPPGVDMSVDALRKLLQDRRVLPWWRAHVPLVLSGRRVVAVGDFWVADDFLAAEGMPGWWLHWRGRERVLAVDAMS